MRNIVIMMLLVLMVCGCKNSKYHDTELEKNVDVISVNKNVLRGKMIGMFLGSPSGAIANDANIIGVKYFIGGEMFLDDFVVEHAILAYYTNEKTIPVKIIFTRWDWDQYRMSVYLNGKRMKTDYYLAEDINSLLDEELNVTEN